MRVALVAIGLVGMLALAGCQNMTAAQQQTNTMNEKIAAGQQEHQACFKRVTSQNANVHAIVTDQVTFLDSRAANKVTLMSSNKKINDTQSVALRKMIESANECRWVLLSALQGSPLFQPFFDYLNSIDALYGQLLNKELTIGQFNTQKIQLQSQRMSNIESAMSRYHSAMADAHNQEVEQRQRAAAIMLPYLAQQQALQQQNMYNQQMLMLQQQQNMMLNQPVNTNCTQFGNQINCRSW